MSVRVNESRSDESSLGIDNFVDLELSDFLACVPLINYLIDPSSRYVQIYISSVNEVILVVISNDSLDVGELGDSSKTSALYTLVYIIKGPHLLNNKMLLKAKALLR